MIDNEFVKIRDSFLEEVKPKMVKSQIDSWNFYTNSNDENMKKL